MVTKVYNDAVCYATIDDNPVTLGHIRVYPHSQITTLEELSGTDVWHLFSVASFAGSILFEGLKAQGTNIVCHNGLDEKPVCIEVIARFENDNLGLIWEPTQGNPQEVVKVAGKIKSAIIPVEIPKQKPIDMGEYDELEVNDTDPRIEHLRRLP